MCRLGNRPYVNQPKTSSNKKRGLFTKDDFVYDSDKDCYHCPGGKELRFHFETNHEKDRRLRYYWTKGCRRCPLQSQCTRNGRRRRIARAPDEQLIDQMNARIAARPEILRRRKALAEHPFGTIKHVMGYRHFLMRRAENVSVEFSLTALAYNLKRVLNLVSLPQMIAALG